MYIINYTLVREDETLPCGVVVDESDLLLLDMMRSWFHPFLKKIVHGGVRLLELKYCCFIYSFPAIAHMKHSTIAKRDMTRSKNTLFPLFCWMMMSAFLSLPPQNFVPAHTYYRYWLLMIQPDIVDIMIRTAASACSMYVPTVPHSYGHVSSQDSKQLEKVGGFVCERQMADSFNIMYCRVTYG